MQQPPPKARRRVLIVDDNVDAAEMLAAMLALDGHEVRVADSGPHALELLHDFHPDIALLDIGLPTMNGYELANHLRKQPALRSLCLIAVTGWGREKDRRQSLEAGFDYHLTKPVESRELRALVAAMGKP
jgi:CheY-like chemotaxis protein